MARMNKEELVRRGLIRRDGIFTEFEACPECGGPMLATEANIGYCIVCPHPMHVLAAIPPQAGWYRTIPRQVGWDRHTFLRIWDEFDKHQRALKYPLRTIPAWWHVAETDEGALATREEADEGFEERDDAREAARERIAIKEARQS